MSWASLQQLTDFNPQRFGNGGEGLNPRLLSTGLCPADGCTSRAFGLLVPDRSGELGLSHPGLEPESLDILADGE